MRDLVLQPELRPAGCWGPRVLQAGANTTAGLPGQPPHLPAQVRPLVEVADDDEPVDGEDGENDVLGVGLGDLV